MALQSQGIEVFWSTSTAAYTSTAIRVGQDRTFNGPGGQSADIDVSHLKSTAHEYLQGLPDDGDFALSVWFDPTSAAEGHKQLMEDRAGRDAVLAVAARPTVNLGMVFIEARKTAAKIEDTMRGAA